jgi:hypothetical protein
MIQNISEIGNLSTRGPDQVQRDCGRKKPESALLLQANSIMQQN